MSTVDSMILVVSSAIVRDLYRNYVNRSLADDRAATMGSVVSFLLGVVVLLLALDPPKYLEYLVLYAIGGTGSCILYSLAGRNLLETR